jgi:hypothetical protein
MPFAPIYQLDGVVAFSILTPASPSAGRPITGNRQGETGAARARSDLLRISDLQGPKPGHRRNLVARSGLGLLWSEPGR